MDGVMYCAEKRRQTLVSLRFLFDFSQLRKPGFLQEEELSNTKEQTALTVLH